MKKLIALLLALCMVLALCACGSKNEGVSVHPKEDDETEEKVEEKTEEPVEEEKEEEPAEVEEPAPTSMSYDEFVAAELDTEVVVEGAVQMAAYNAEYGNICLFLQNEDGAYYVYRMNVSVEDAEGFVPGAMVRITGFKSEWAGEVEIVDATFEFIDGSYTAEAKDITGLLAKDNLIDDINKFVSIRGAYVVSNPLYNWDGSGMKGDDVYVTFEVMGNEYSFLVESDEFEVGSDVYTAAESLVPGDTVDIEGYLYWYEGVQLHMSSITESTGIYCVDYIDESIYDGTWVTVCDLLNMYVPSDWEEIPVEDDSDFEDAGVYCYLHAPGDEDTAMVVTLVDSGLGLGETLPIEDLKDEFINQGMYDARVAVINDSINTVAGTLDDMEIDTYTVNMFVQTDDVCYVMTIMFHPASEEAFRPYIFNMINSISAIS